MLPENTARARAEAILKGHPEWVGLEPPILEPAEREWIARRTRSDTNTHHLDSPRLLAARLGVTVGCATLPNFEGELGFGRRVFYRPRCDRREQGGFVLHGVGHVVLLDSGLEHSEADAWLITGELLLPSRALVDTTHLDALHAPAWLVHAWLGARASMRPAPFGALTPIASQTA